MLADCCKGRGFKCFESKLRRSELAVYLIVKAFLNPESRAYFLYIKAVSVEDFTGDDGVFVGSEVHPITFVPFARNVSRCV